jgi:hypothetical protein
MMKRPIQHMHTPHTCVKSTSAAAQQTQQLPLDFRLTSSGPQNDSKETAIRVEEPSVSKSLNTSVVIPLRFHRALI